MNQLILLVSPFLLKGILLSATKNPDPHEVLGSVCQCSKHSHNSLLNPPLFLSWDLHVSSLSLAFKSHMTHAATNPVLPDVIPFHNPI